MATKFAIFGASGQVGFELVRTLMPLGDVVPITRSEVDLTDPQSIDETLRSIRPDLVVNAAAYTAVDRAESEPDAAAAINTAAPAQMAKTCLKIGARLIHYSTDYVFDGIADEPYSEGTATRPLGVYGRTKRDGEAAVLDTDPRNIVLRVAWVYGTRGRNFLLTMLRLAKEGKPIRIVNDQHGAPTWSRAIAEATAQIGGHLIRNSDEPGGLFHLPAGGQTSWFGFAEAILKSQFGEAAPMVVPIPSSEYPTPAPRPSYSVLNGDKAKERFGVALPPWESQLRLVLEELRP